MPIQIAPSFLAYATSALPLPLPNLGFLNAQCQHNNEPLGKQTSINPLSAFQPPILNLIELSVGIRFPTHREILVTPNGSALGEKDLAALEARVITLDTLMSKLKRHMKALQLPGNSAIKQFTPKNLKLIFANDQSFYTLTRNHHAESELDSNQSFFWDRIKKCLILDQNKAFVDDKDILKPETLAQIASTLFDSRFEEILQEFSNLLPNVEGVFSESIVENLTHNEFAVRFIKTLTEVMSKKLLDSQASLSETAQYLISIVGEKTLLTASLNADDEAIKQALFGFYTIHANTNILKILSKEIKSSENKLDTVETFKYLNQRDFSKALELIQTVRNTDTLKNKGFMHVDQNQKRHICINTNTNFLIKYLICHEVTHLYRNVKSFNILLHPNFEKITAEYQHLPPLKTLAHIFSEGSTIYLSSKIEKPPVSNTLNTKYKTIEKIINDFIEQYGEKELFELTFESKAFDKLMPKQIALKWAKLLGKFDNFIKNHPNFPTMK